MTADFNVILNFNSAKPVITGAQFKAGDKGFTINMDVRELDPTGMTPKIAFYRSNGTSVESAAVTNVGNIFSYTLLGNELAVPGVVVSDLKFYDGDDQRISSASFIFTAIADTLDGLGGGTESYSDELEQLSAEFQDTLDDYIDAFGNTAPINPRGDYDNAETYEPRDMVYDPNTGTSWVAKVETTGHAPASPSSYWQKLVNGSGSMAFDDLSDVDMTDVTDGQVPAYDSNSGKYKPVTPFPEGVTSFNGRNGAVSPTAGDYSADKISYDHTVSGLSATESKSALDELAARRFSNPNLLINGRFTVNQREAASYSASGYTVDHWRTWAATTTVAVTNDGITITNSTTENYVLTQYLESSLLRSLRGKTVTVSLLLLDGSIIKASGTVPSSGNYSLIAEGTGVKIRLNIGSSNQWVDIDVDGTKYIREAKLELGSISTIALDADPDYATELLKCQWYYRRIKSYKTSNSEIGIGFVTAAEWVFLSIPNIKMRTTSPTMALGGGMSFLYNGTSYTPSNVTFSFNSDASFIVWLKFTGTSFTSGQGGIVYLAGNGDYIEIECEL